MNGIYSVYEDVHVQNDRESPYISTYLAKSYFIGMKEREGKRAFKEKGTTETIRKGKKSNHRLRKSQFRRGNKSLAPPSHHIPLRTGAHCVVEM